MILIIGGSGFLGYYLHQSLNNSKDKIISTYKNTIIKEKGFCYLDITDKKNTAKLVRELQPDIIIYAAGITDVDLCEKNKKLAKAINADGIKNVIDNIKNMKSKIVYISTSAVFDGSKNFYLETDKTNPISYYGKSKLEGEKIVQNSGLPYLIIRTDQPYGWKKNWHHTNSVLRILENFEKGKIHNEILDWYNTPTFVNDFVTAVMKLLCGKNVGIFHIVGSDFKNRFNFAQIVVDVFDLDRKKIKSISSFDLNLPAKRANVRLKSSKNRKANIKMSSLKVGLKQMKKSIKKID